MCSYIPRHTHTFALCYIYTTTDIFISTFTDSSNYSKTPPYTRNLLHILEISSIYSFPKNVQKFPRHFGTSKSVSKAFLDGRLQDFDLTFVTTTFKNRIPKTILVKHGFGHFSNPKNVQIQIFFIKVWVKVFSPGWPAIPYNIRLFSYGYTTLFHVTGTHYVEHYR